MPEVHKVILAVWALLATMWIRTSRYLSAVEDPRHKAAMRNVGSTKRHIE